jgi:hypothetical protein
MARLCGGLLVAVAASLGACTAAHARGKGGGTKTWTEPELASRENPDFLVQGEYVCGMHGLQVVALGKGRFYAARLAGGLPGAGWDGRSVEGALLDTEGVQALVERGGFKRVERKSPTLGAKPPAGANVLFDSARAKESLANWAGGKATPEGLLIEGTRTAKQLGSFRLHLEFRMPFKPDRAPSNQDRGNSGVYTFNRYETQLLDSFGLHFNHIDEGKKNSSAWKAEFKKHLGFGPQSDRTQWCGCFYKFKTPKVNMSYPPLAWQTYDITFTAPRFEGDRKTVNARITVLHNGVTIHDDVELPKGTGAGGGRREVPRECIYLQGHGNPVRFRNIWYVPRD